MSNGLYLLTYFNILVNIFVVCERWNERTEMNYAYDGLYFTRRCVKWLNLSIYTYHSLFVLNTFKSYCWMSIFETQTRLSPTLFIPNEVEWPVDAVIPSSSGKAWTRGSLMTTLTPDSGLRTPTYSGCATRRVRCRPAVDVFICFYVDYFPFKSSKYTLPRLTSKDPIT